MRWETKTMKTKITLKHPITIKMLRAYNAAGLAVADGVTYIQNETALLTDTDRLRALFGDLFEGNWSGFDFENADVNQVRAALNFFGEKGLGLIRNSASPATKSFPDGPALSADAPENGNPMPGN